MDNPVLWVRVDPELEWLAEVCVKQPDGMRITMLERETTIDGQVRFIHFPGPGGGDYSAGGERRRLVRDGERSQELSDQRGEGLLPAEGNGSSRARRDRRRPHQLDGPRPPAQVLQGAMLRPVGGAGKPLLSHSSTTGESNSPPNWMGLDPLLKVFKEQCFDLSVGQLRPNDFSNLAEHYVDQVRESGIPVDSGDSGG
eukprot:189814-Prorocentrum_minimum.AAC.1